MDDHKWLAQQFEADRDHLRAVAYRMLGSLSEADDAVQEAWLRLSRSDRGDVVNLRAWLTTVVGRVCLNMLRARRSRREEALDVAEPEPIAVPDTSIDPEQEALLADSVGLALLVVLEALGPAERVAFVLHDLFDLPFDEIAQIVGRSPAAARQLASRARRRVQGSRAPNSNLTEQREVVDAFLNAARGGSFDRLLAILDPEVVLRADQAAVPPGAPRTVTGAWAVAKRALGFSERSRFAQAALVNRTVGVIVAPRGRLFVVLGFMIKGRRIVEVDVIADPERLRTLDLAVLE